MKTILCVSPYYKEEHRWMACTLQLKQIWLNMGYRVVVICMHSKAGIIEQSENFILFGVKDFFVPDPFNFGIAPTFYYHVLALIKDYQPDKIVVTNLLFWTSWSAILLRLLGYKPIVVTDALVGMTWWPRKWYMKIIMGIGGWTMGLLTMKAATSLVLFHPQPVKLLQIIGVNKKTRIIPSGINTLEYNFTMEKYKNPNPLYISYVGRLESIKGVDDFCAVILAVQKKYPHIQGQVIGKYNPNLSLFKRYKDHLKFTGLVNNVGSFLQKTHIFVLPSYSEGLSNALMEAMCSGCVCIASSVGGNNYLLNEGKCGLLFVPGDRKQLENAIIRSIENTDYATSLAKAARTRIESVFDWSIVQKDYMKLFSE